MLKRHPPRPTFRFREKRDFLAAFERLCIPYSPAHVLDNHC
jgi:hypothetical protein